MSCLGCGPSFRGLHDKLLLLDGTNLSPIVDALRRQHGRTAVLRDTQHYIPNHSVPAAALYPNHGDKVAALLQAGAGLSGSHFVVVGLSDGSPAKWPAVVNGLQSNRDVSPVVALVYEPLPSLVASATSMRQVRRHVVNFLNRFRVARGPTDLVTVGRWDPLGFNAELEALPGRLGGTNEDVASLRYTVGSVLPLTDSGCPLSPVLSSYHDVLVDATQPDRAARAILRAAVQPGVGRQLHDAPLGGSLFTNDLPFLCAPCSTDLHGMCGNCLNALHTAIAPGGTDVQAMCADMQSFWCEMARQSRARMCADDPHSDACHKWTTAENRCGLHPEAWRTATELRMGSSPVDIAKHNDAEIHTHGCHIDGGFCTHLRAAMYKECEVDKKSESCKEFREAAAQCEAKRTAPPPPHHHHHHHHGR